ncbi:hypothetical protein Bsub01_04004 [Bacillus subtilis]|uniref:Uncharacterized protein n=1 Tax=Bacillus subtilis subsp. natto TaxID=86029 RepID=E9RJ79_BACNA|nr:hypothetical protein S100333_04515 [Bacillus subtilis subsp. subtilis]BAJ76994.1 hypothetical protein [Bacillus subtilis subsp. natto]BEH08378.1 hypothetical protein BSNN_44110 [Bacillus subtilis subsp. natto]
MKYILSVLLIEWLINKALDLLFDYIAIKVKSFLERKQNKYPDCFEDSRRHRL